MTTDFDIYTSSKAWPFVEAKRIYDDIAGKTPAKGYVLFETGYGPSGLPHIGTFGEVTRTTMVMNAFRKICDIPTKLICFSDDIDGLRKVPDNMPNKELIAQYLNKPLTSVPDPFGEKESYGHYMNAKLRSFLDRFGFEYEFYSATECYKSGKFDHMMIRVIEKYDEIMALMLPTFREERKQTYSPFMPICPKTGDVLQVPIEKLDLKSGTISYLDPNDNELMTVPVTGGHCKLQWKPDFGMRWCALDVDYEMYGKDHMPNAPIYSKICNILGADAPVQFFYELFLDKDGAKISKSKGNSISIEEWLHYAPKESLSLFMYQSPSRAKRLFFDVIPKCVDEYLAFNKSFHQSSELDKKIANPAYHIHNAEVPILNNYDISFSLLLNLASVCNPDNKDILWAFISRYAPQANRETTPYLDHLAEFAVNYYNDFVKKTKEYVIPDERQKLLLGKIVDLLEKTGDSTSAEEIQNQIYSVGTEANYENLRDFFKEIYQILLGQTEGPRLGSFFKLYGIQDTINLIKEKMDA